MLGSVDRQRDRASLDEQVIVGGRDEHRAGLERLLVLGVADGERAARGEQLREPVAVAVRAAMLGDDDRGAEVARAAAEDALDGIQPTP